MAKAKPKAAQLSREDKLKILKKAKLYSGTTKIEKGKASGAQKRALAKFRSDIPLIASGKAKTLDVSKVAKDKRPTFLHGTSKRVVVPVEDKKSRPRINKKTGQITAIARTHGRKFRQIFYDQDGDLSKLPRGKQYRYQVQFAGWGMDSTIFSDIGKMQEFMQPYQDRAKNPWTDWAAHVSVLEVLGPISDDEDGEDE